jgi:hypothetical protein
MAGVMSLMQGPQGQQGPMPGQAQQQPMPGMMPQQGAPAQGIAPNPFKNQKLDELLYLYRNPQLIPEGQTYRVITALSEAVKAEKLKKAGQDQQAMAQNAQMQQEPPIAEGLAQQAQALMQQPQQQPVMAAYGGEMHGYAGGGAVAFTNGTGPAGVPQENPEEDISDDPRLSFTERRIRAEKRAALARKQGIGRSFSERYPGVSTAAPEVSQTDTGDEVTRMLARNAPPTPMISPEAAALMQRQGPRGIASPSAPARTGVGSAAAAPTPGLPGLMGPQIDPDRLMARQGQQTIAAALERGAQPTPEEIKARGGIDSLMKEMIDARRAEEQRQTEQSKLRMEEAKSRYNRPFFQDPTALGELIAGMRGAKTAYEGMTGAAAAGGKAQGAREQAMRQAEEKFDVSQKDVFNLSNLRQQVQLDQAKLAEARASGDAQRSVNAAMKLGESQQKLAEFEANISDKAAGRRLQEEGIQVQREQIKSSERISELNRNAQAALRNLPGPEQQMVERAIKSLQDANPGMPYHEAYDKVRGAGKGLEERAEAARAKNATARQKLLNENMTYFSAQNTYISATDPAKKAEALRKMKEIERLNGIIDETAAAPAGGAVDKSNPLLK